MNFKEKKYSEYYLTYFGLDMNARIRYYHEEIETNVYLDFYERIELDIDYAQVLFEIGKYEKFLYLIDHLIEIVIEENIHFLNGQDIYEILLVKKSKAHFYLDEMEQASYVADQVIKINPLNHQAKEVLLQIKKRFNDAQQYWLLQPIAVIAGIFTILFMVLDIFIIDAFFNQYHALMTWMGRIMFCISVLSFGIIHWRLMTDYFKFKMNKL